MVGRKKYKQIILIRQDKTTHEGVSPIRHIYSQLQSDLKVNWHDRCVCV